MFILCTLCSLGMPTWQVSPGFNMANKSCITNFTSSLGTTIKLSWWMIKKHPWASGGIPPVASLDSAEVMRQIMHTSMSIHWLFMILHFPGASPTGPFVPGHLLCVWTTQGVISFHNENILLWNFSPKSMLKPHRSPPGLSPWSYEGVLRFSSCLMRAVYTVSPR